MKRWLITLCVFLISLSDINIREAGSQQQVDKSGLNLLCTQPGDVYSPCSKGGVSVCLTKDGDSIVCDCKTEVCTKNEEGNKPKPNATAGIRGLVELQFLDNIRKEVNTLTTQMSSLLTGQSTLTNEVGDLQALCSLSDLVPRTKKLATGPLQTLGDPVDVCQRDDQGRLIFRVHNQGGVDAPASTTRVFFRCPVPELAGTTPCTSPTQVDIPTPALPGFTATDDMAVPIPNNCFNKNNECEFTIGVDVGEVVTESRESNNTAVGVCGAFIL